ncbi:MULTISPECIES: DEAD/DEAH box helicase [unclassified Oceanispirochaeta]|uniref:DEAD/DEAH box helicase n=1 Tax=unclassified Oceanispirochaeta TaxID=2635722 RepID=UPI000E09D0A5|nr:MULTISPECIES: DEAD/DEAH box helicase [unclassified Oceanispirochaeta]MBF9015966.1 DEAD/DEAH box helicase [Oceanispirochaeta sp. M2]NPD72429.1 DEAD/DEAH box helicase [Oceanispirochaeta sp. M1]RDG32197.1 ATP-dependent helicase [Oceanispirochaeta sp. M1]
MTETALQRIYELARTEKKRHPPGDSLSDPGFFVLDADREGRCFIRLTDSRGEDFRGECSSDDPLLESLYRRIGSIRSRQAGLISWKQDPRGLYLDEYPSLPGEIRDAGEILYWKNTASPLIYEQGAGHVRLVLEKIESSYEINLEFQAGTFLSRDPRPLSPLHLRVGDRLFDCSSLGSRYHELTTLAGRIAREEAESFLSLFCSLFPRLEINLDDYSHLDRKMASAEACLSFESLLNDGTLKMSMRYCFNHMPMEFISGYRPSSVIRVDHEHRTLQELELSYPGNHDSMKFITRDLKKMTREMGLSGDFVHEEDDLYLSAALALPFLSSRLGELTGSYRLFGSESLRKLKLKPVQPRLQFSLGEGIDYFEGTGTMILEDESFPIEKALSLFETHNYIPLSDGSKAIVDRSYFSTLKRLLGKYNKKNTAYRVSIFDLPLMEQLIDSRIEGEGMIRSRKLFEGFNSIEESPLSPFKLKGKLRDYQVYGVKWMHYLQNFGLGGCLADDMGLGKTIQALALLSLYYKGDGKKKPSLVVMPRSLLHNWEKEKERFAPHLRSCCYYGSQRDVDQISKHQIVFTTYALVRNDIEVLQNISFSYLILDESQAIKNMNSRIARGVMLLDGEHRLALSGTPVENNLGELYSLFRFLNPSMFGSAAQFKRDYITPIQKNSDPTALRLLRGKISPFLLRRLKQQVAKELPERSEQILYVDMESEQAALYEERRRFYEGVIHEKVKVEGVEKSQFLILQGLLELRQLASVPEAKTEGQVVSAKWNALLQHMEEVISEGHRALVFTNFLSSVEIMQERLTEAGIAHLTMTGSTRNRAELVEEFQSSTENKVFIMTLKTGGVGLNLTGADYVYILDPWWNRSAEQQAIDRTHRIGQTRNVFCYRMISVGTIEEKIMELQERKKELFSSVLGSDSGSDSGSVKKLSPEDINYLLQRGM